MKTENRQVEQADAVAREGKAAEIRGDLVAAAASYRALAELPDPVSAAEGHFRLGRLAWRQGHFEDALAAYARMLDLGNATGRDDIVARAHNGRGAVHYSRGEYAQAQACYRLAMSLTPDASRHAPFLLNLGVIANIQGDLLAAQQNYSRACALSREHHDSVIEALALHNLGMVHADLEEWDEADDAFKQALALFEAQSNRPMIASALVNRSEVLLAQAALAEAVRHCELAIAMYDELGDELGRGEAQRWQGRALRERGDMAAAERALVDAVHVAVRYRVKLLEAEASRELAVLKRTAGHTDEADRWEGRAMALFRELGAHRELAALEGA